MANLHGFFSNRCQMEAVEYLEVPLNVSLSSVCADKLSYTRPFHRSRSNFTRVLVVMVTKGAKENGSRGTERKI